MTLYTAWAGLVLFAALVGYTDYNIRKRKKRRSAKEQVRRLQAEAKRDRSNDWDRHRGGE